MKLCIALDCTDKKVNDEIIEAVKKHYEDDFIKKVVLKVGSINFTKYGSEYIKELSNHKVPIFLDLKYHDTPNTMKEAVNQAADLGVDMVSIHMDSGHKAIAECCKVLRDNCYSTKLIGIPLLTSLLDNYGVDSEGAPSCGSREFQSIYGRTQRIKFENVIDSYKEFLFYTSSEAYCLHGLVSNFPYSLRLDAIRGEFAKVDKFKNRSYFIVIPGFSAESLLKGIDDDFDRYLYDIYERKFNTFWSGGDRFKFSNPMDMIVVGRGLIHKEYKKWKISYVLKRIDKILSIF